MKKRLQSIFNHICLITILSTFVFAVRLSAQESVPTFTSREVPHIECKDHTDEINQLLVEYINKRVKNLPTTHEPIVKILTHIKESEKEECFNSAINKYVANLVEILSSKSKPFHLFESKKKKKFDLLTILNILTKNHKLVAIDPAERKVLSGFWLKKNDKDNYENVGAYECAQSKVYFDYTLPPFNLATVVVHELDHLFRDKFFVPTDLSVQEYIFIDEFAANIYSATYQVHAVGRPSQIKYILGKKVEETYQFTSDEDMSYFIRSGNLHRLWYNYESLFESSFGMFPNNFNREWYQKAREGTFINEFLFQEDNLKQYEHYSYLAYLMKNFSHVYYRMYPDVSHVMSRLSQQKNLSPLGLWIYDDQVDKLTDNLNNALKKSSSNCEWSKNGTVHGNEGVRNGNEGVRNGNGNLRSCNTEKVM